MSVPVELEALRAEIGQRVRPAYLVTASGDGPPHTVAAFVRWRDGALETGCGNTTARNLTARAAATLLFPPDDPADYTLIVDVEGAVVEAEERIVRLTPTHAVLHRPAVNADGADCGHDCAPLT